MTEVQKPPPPNTRPGAPPAPRPPERPRSPTATIPSLVPIETSFGVIAGSDRIVIYGTGGIGKTTLAAFLPMPLFLDVERSTRKLKVHRETASDWMTMRGKLASVAASPPELDFGDGKLRPIRTLVVDSATVAEEMAKEHVIASRTTEKGNRVDSIEGFGWGKGWQFVYDEMNGLIADLDRIAATGLNVCLIAHDSTSLVPNPSGEDYIRWEPHLYSGDKRGRGSVRERIKEWADHLCFVGYDVYVRGGKGEGAGTRTIYTQELPTHVAKSRSHQVCIPFELEDAGRIWRELGIS